MRQSLTLFAAAALAAGTLNFMGYDHSVLAADDKAVGASGSVTAGGAGLQASGRMSLPQGITPSQQSDNQGIQKTLGAVTEAVLQPAGQMNLSQYLVSSDRTRLSNIQSGQFRQQLDQLRQAYKQKYNKDIEIEEQVVFGEQFKNFEIVQGEVSNPALLSNWPIQSSSTTTNIRTNTTEYNRSGTGTPGSTPGTASPRSDAGGTQRDIANVGRPGTPPNEVTPDDQNRGVGSQQRNASGNNNTPRESTRDRADAGGPGQPSNVGISGQAGTSAGSTSASGSTTILGEPARASGTSTIGGAAGATGLNRGMNVAIVTFPASHGAPELTVSLVRESGTTGGAGATGAAPGAPGSININDRSSGTGTGTGASRDQADVGRPGSPPEQVTPDRSNTGIGTQDRNTSGNSNTPRENSRDQASAGGPGQPSNVGVSGQASAGSADRSSSVSGAGTAGSSSSTPGQTGASGSATAGRTGAAGAASGDWKIDVPDQITSDQLQRNLQKHLTEINQMKDQWPQDATEAQRMIAHHVLMAFYDTGAQPGGAGTTGGTRSGASGTDRSPTGTGTPGSSSPSGTSGSSSGTSGGTSGAVSGSNAGTSSGATGSNREPK